MKLAPFASGLAVATAVALAHGPAAHAQTQNKNQSNQAKNTVVVHEGDTLDGIATLHQTTYVRLFDANTEIQDPNIIYPGQNVRIPDANEPSAAIGNCSRAGCPASELPAAELRASGCNPLPQRQRLGRRSRL
jgi:LysM repeat protein